MGNESKLRTKYIPKELDFILALLSSKDFLWDGCELSRIDWSKFLQQCMHHRVFPVVYKRLKTIGKPIVPSYIIRRLEHAYKQNTFRMLHLTSEMEQFSQLFSGKEIPFLYLKGPVLAHELYGDISLRTSSDLDVLIPIKKLKEVEELLVQNGYEKDEYIQSVLNDWRWRHHHFTYFHPYKKIKIEIHWRLNPGPGKEPSFSELWCKKKKCDLTDQPVYMLGNEDLFYYLITHGARHGWSRLRWLVDIKQLVEKEFSWTHVYNLLKRYHTLHVGGQVLTLLSQLLEVNIPNRMKPLTMQKRSIHLAQDAVFYMERMVNLHNEPLPTAIANYHKRHLFSLMSFQQKWYFILSFLHPYPEDAATLPLPKRLHLLYFPLRPFLWAWRKTRKHAIS